jgi:nudix-type nucleoside diphosphatase (YffH/AdpP family)
LKIERRELLYEGWNKFHLLTVHVAEGANREHMLLEQKDAACVLPYHPDRKIAVMVCQARVAPTFQHAVAKLLEAPAGGLDDETPEAGAHREALEEAGLALHDLEFVAQVWPDPGCLTTRISLFLASITSSNRVTHGGGLAEEHEDIDVLEIPLATLARMVDDGEVTDLKTFALIQTLRVKRPDLFDE